MNALLLKEETAEFIADTRVDIETDVINSDLVERILNDTGTDTVTSNLSQS
ncbi:hypothetical protein PDJ84_26790 [Bacillus cereus]|uniref:hypothetical protein n=1 Tax=Bacillus cereus group TaxID=86661 RepID=UPI001F3C18D2|nr:hypothetical protein [Bacillus cereus]MDA1521527.1 hypothetical protein [Bacillus cereus]